MIQIHYLYHCEFFIFVCDNEMESKRKENEDQYQGSLWKKKRLNSLLKAYVQSRYKFHYTFMFHHEL
jgi:hypothetical protein